MKIRNRRQPFDFRNLGDGPQEGAHEAAAETSPDTGVEPDEAQAPSALDLPPDDDLDLAEAPGEPAAGSDPLRLGGELAGDDAIRLADPASKGHVTAPRGEVATTASLDEMRAAREARKAHAAPPAWPIYGGAAALSALWALAPIAYAWGYRGEVVPFQNDVFALGVFALLAIAPAVLVWVAAYAVREGQKLAAEARRAQAMADEMLTPALLAAGRAGDVAQGVREEIVRAGEAAQEARETLLALRAALAAETEQLVAAAASSARTAEGLTRALSDERGQMQALAQGLDAQSTAVIDAITRQARMVAEASDLAETQLREAEASLAARAADLAAAAGETSDVARVAAEDLTRQIARLETAGAGVAEQVGAAETGLSQQRAALVALAHGLRADQESFAAEAETHTAKLSEFLSEARLSAVEMGDRAMRGAQVLRDLVAEASEQFRDLAEAAHGERDAFGQSIRQSWGELSDMAAEERARLERETRAAITALLDAAEETRAAAERHGQAARQQVDQLSEAAFAAGQKADQVFEGRLEEARALIERSASLVDEAGALTARKLEAGAAAARQTLQDLQDLFAELDARTAELPASAERQARAVREAVAENIEGLLDQARQAAEETQAIDAAFQERVSRNYEMLSEAVRLMGSVATTASQGLATGAGLPPTPSRERRPLAREPAPRETSRETGLRPPTYREPPRREEPRSPPSPLDEPLELSERAPREERRLSAQEAGLRPRLRLTPTATDEEFSNLFEAAGGPPAAAEPEAPEEGDGLTWKDLLASIDTPQARARPTDERREAALLADIVEMGIDPGALLPRGRIEEIGAAVQTGDLEGARQVVRRLAPAATRRLTRRLFTDDGLKAEAGAYLARYRGMLEEAVDRDQEGFMVATLLASDAGRVFLLLDAAAGDMM